MPGTDAQTRWLSADEQQAWRATVHLSQLLMRQLDRDLNAHGLNAHDYEILVELSEAPDHRLRMTELADATSQSRSRLSHQISRMENRGLVRRDDCEGDKRGTFAVLTADGVAAIERVAPDHVENVRRHFIDRLSPRQLEEIKDTFAPIVEYLRKIRDRDLMGSLEDTVRLLSVVQVPHSVLLDARHWRHAAAAQRLLVGQRERFLTVRWPSQ